MHKKYFKFLRNKAKLNYEIKYYYKFKLKLNVCTYKHKELACHTIELFYRELSSLNF